MARSPFPAQGRETLTFSCGCSRAESQFLQEQAEAIKTVSEYVSQLRRVGKGLGVFEFDRYLSDQIEGAA